MIVRQAPYNQILIISTALVSILLIIMVRIYYQNYISSLFNLDFISKNLVSKNILDNSIEKTSPASVNLLTTTAILSVAAIFFLSFTYLLPEHNYVVELSPTLLYVYTLITVTLYFSLKFAFLTFTGFVFDSKETSDMYIHNTFSNYRLAGLILIPIYICAAFTDEFWQLTMVYVGLGVLAIFMFARIIKGFILSFRIKLSFHYTILYLCSLEIFPLLIIFEYIRRAM